MADPRLTLTAAMAALMILSGSAAAQQAPAPATGGADQTITLPTVEVIAATPLLGSGVDRNKVPAANYVLNPQDISRAGYPNALGALNDQVPGVTLDQAAGNPFQPSLFYHGFQASPLQGTPQGLAVYVNGARFNQPFGDTVNWDLLPSIAIDRMDLLGSNPVFGLNALGGALAVQMKNGFTYHGAEVDALGGSFDLYQGEAQAGVQTGNTAAYLAVNGLHEGGWRDLQSSDLANLYGDIGWRGDRGELHVNVIAANNRLNGPGTSPVQLLAVDPAAQFTAPNLITNQYTQVNLTTSYQISDNTSLQGSVYAEYLLQKVANGNVPNATPCNDGSGFLCVSPGVYAIGRDGNPITDFLSGGPYSDLDQQSTNTHGYGAALQLNNRHPLFGHPNQLIAGISFDGGQTLFGASTEIGGLTPDSRVFYGPGITIDQPDGSIAPVRVSVSNAYYGAFFTDTFDITPSLSANAAGRYNFAQINLSDQLGAALSGNHSYGHFNPAGGLTWKFLPGVSAYASYAEANRAPTPEELTCASATSPCSLANFFVGDPNLQQVVAHTVEAGLRGRLHPFSGGTLSTELAYYHTTLDNDILFVNSPIQGRAFFQNVGSTLRQGFDIDLQLKTERWFAWLAYSYIDAQFQTGFTESSENNPAADINGNIQIQPGDRLPGIPANTLKLGVDYKLTDAWTVGGSGIYASGQYLFGDEANLTAPTPPYFVVNLHTQYQVTKNLQLFALLQNAFNVTYYTYGTFSQTSAIPIVQVPGANNPRSYSPAAPIGVTVGLRATF
jgi:iron complex outermembrane receptor protein